MGIFSSISLVTRVDVFAAVGKTADLAGRSNTSSKVSARGMAFTDLEAMSFLRPKTRMTPLYTHQL